MGFLGDVLNYAMDWKFLLEITGLAIAGILIGNFLSKRFGGPALRRAFGWFTLFMGTGILIRELLFT
jgi:hypothetical protein